MASRVIAIWLDAFDVTLADRFELPNLSRLACAGVVCTLDNGVAQLTGLTGEHISSGLDPQGAERASAVQFDPRTYKCWQEGFRLPPVFGGTPTVVFDACYFDLDRTGEEVVGITDWGAHDPGGPPRSRPDQLLADVEQRFGRYPARKWVYATPWSSRDACLDMGRALSAAVRTRSHIVRWLLGDRFQDWRLALIGVSEAHGASEGLMHGGDPHHVLAGVDSAPAAAEALRSVYTAIDDLVGDVASAFPDDIVIPFSMHGMGENTSDVPSMVLLGELLARWSGMKPVNTHSFPVDKNGVPQLNATQTWSRAVYESLSGAKRRAHHRLKVRGAISRVVSILRRSRFYKSVMSSSQRSSHRTSLNWMPLMRHQPQWSQMKAFAIPSFYDGRIRVNLSGRESRGIVTDYEKTLEEIETLLKQCVESRTGRPAVERVERRGGDPLTRRDDDVDLVVHWNRDVLGLSHPLFGVFGPLPPRRTGGHTSPVGRCVIAGPGIVSADLGVHSSFDVVPTVLKLAGVTPSDSISGHALPVG